MPQTRPCDVSPDSPQDKYSLALQDVSGRWYGLDVPLPSIRPSTQNQQAPLQRVGFNSFHAGRGFERYAPDQFGYFDARNLWRTTQGKGHAVPLMRWGRGLRNTDWNMPNGNGVTWKPLTGSTKYLDVSFTAGASYTAAKLILLIRKRVPAGTVGAPGTLTAEICANNATPTPDEPSTVLETVTLTADDVDDVTSEYYIWTISEALTSGTIYHIKVYGPSGDRDKACWEVACDNAAAGLRSSNGSAWTATTYSPYFRVTDADKARTFKQFVFDNALYAVSLYDNRSTTSELFLQGVRGRAVGTQTSTTIQDTGHGTYGATNWTTDRFAGCFVRIIRGTGAGQVRQIASNTADTLTVTTAWSTTPVASDSEYIVYGCDWWVEIGTTGLGVVTGKPVVQNGTVYFPQGDATNIRIMRLDYTDADDHGFDVENTNNNKAYFLASGFDPAQGPQLWRANNAVTTGTPAAKKVSVARAPTSPAGTPVPFGTDVTFLASILTGDNTNQITNIYYHEGNLHVGKENTLYVIQNDQPAKINVGVETAPDINNFCAMITAADRQLYASYLNDVYLVGGSGSYPTGLMNAMPFGRSGYAADLEAKKGWLFAVVDAGDSGTSSLMMYSLAEQAWSELLRGFATGRRMRSVQWQDNPGTRPRLWTEIGGELVFQEFPLNGVRPYDDSNMKYQPEFVLVLPTIDMNTTDSKYFARLTVTSQGLATSADTESGHELVVEWQADNDVGSENWQHGGYIYTSPTGFVDIARGDKRMIRIRLRGMSSEAYDPVIVETISLTLFSRGQLSEAWNVYFQVAGDDEEQNSYELLKWLREKAERSQPLRMMSRFALYHNRTVTLSDFPRYALEEVNAEENEIEAQLQLQLVEVT
jgi:hypothetical protein